MDAAFRALADPSRRRLLDSLNARGGQTLRELCAGLDMARQSVSKHLGVLEEAGLVTTLWQGREKLHFLNAEPINAIADRWMSQYDRRRAQALADLKTALEKPVSTATPIDPATAFVYTTYIRTTPEALWKALTEPAFIERYWGARLESDWQPGSTYTWAQNGATVGDAEMVVLESDPPHRLAYTFHTFDPDFMAAAGVDPQTVAEMAREPRSKVAFEIEALDGQVKLTVVHDDMAPGGTVRRMVSGGWPQILSNLKTLLETGETLPTGAPELRAHRRR